MLMLYHRYKLDVNADGSCNVIDVQHGDVAEMDGEFLNRMSRELAEELMFLLNSEEERLAARPK
jgi:hypothetical protein